MSFVDPGGAAEKAGIQVGSMIIKVNGTPVSSKTISRTLKRTAGPVVELELTLQVMSSTPEVDLKGESEHLKEMQDQLAASEQEFRVLLSNCPYVMSPTAVFHFWQHCLTCSIFVYRVPCSYLCLHIARYDAPPWNLSCGRQ